MPRRRAPPRGPPAGGAPAGGGPLGTPRGPSRRPCPDSGSPVRRRSPAPPREGRRRAIALWRRRGEQVHRKSRRAPLPPPLVEPGRDTQPHLGLREPPPHARPVPVPAVTALPGPGLTLGCVEGRLKDRPAKALGSASPTLPVRRHRGDRLAPVGNVAGGIEREAPAAVHFAPHHQKREAGARLPLPPVIPGEPARAPPGPASRPLARDLGAKPAVRSGPIGNDHEGAACIPGLCLVPCQRWLSCRRHRAKTYGRRRLLRARGSGRGLFPFWIAQILQQGRSPLTPRPEAAAERRPGPWTMPHRPYNDRYAGKSHAARHRGRGTSEAPSCPSPLPGILQRVPGITAIGPATQ